LTGIRQQYRSLPGIGDRAGGELEGEIGGYQGADVAVDAFSETSLPVEVDKQALPAEELLGLDGPKVVEPGPVAEENEIP
jgi:hypothetical protein